MPPGTGHRADLSPSFRRGQRRRDHTAGGFGADTRRAVRMYQKLNVPTLGLVENMSHFVCPSCSHESDIFGKGGGEALATELSVPFLGRVPIYEPIRIGGDTGVPITIGEPNSAAARAFRAAAEQLAAQISIASYKRPNAIPVRRYRFAGARWPGCKVLRCWCEVLMKSVLGSFVMRCGVAALAATPSEELKAIVASYPNCSAARGGQVRRPTDGSQGITLQRRSGSAGDAIGKAVGAVEAGHRSQDGA